MKIHLYFSLTTLEFQISNILHLEKHACTRIRSFTLCIYFLNILLHFVFVDFLKEFSFCFANFIMRCFKFVYQIMFTTSRFHDKLKCCLSVMYTSVSKLVRRTPKATCEYFWYHIRNELYSAFEKSGVNSLLLKIYYTHKLVL